MELLAEETPTHNLEEEGERNKIRHWTRVPAVSHTENCGCLKSVSETPLQFESLEAQGQSREALLGLDWKMGNICDEWTHSLSTLRVLVADVILGLWRSTLV